MKNKLIFSCIFAVALLVLASLPSVISFNVINESKEECIEYTTELCGIGDFEPNAVKLTKQESEELELLFDKIKSDLDNAKSEEEMEEIFNKAIDKFDEHGLLGKLTAGQAKKLITNRYKIQKSIHQHVEISGEKQKGSENYLCLVAGNTTETFSYGLLWKNSLRMSLILLNIFSKLYEGLENDGFSRLSKLITLFSIPIIIGLYAKLFLGLFTSLNPLLLGGTICLGSTHIGLPPGGNRKNPSVGWVYSIGLNGIKNWTGSFYGQLPVMHGGYTLLITSHDAYPGIFGFTGIKIYTKYDYYPSLYLGSALWVGIGPDIPE